jgi:5-methyltetrahydropteroyltriglutamate--homocysteine methyltransferase
MSGVSQEMSFAEKVKFREQAGTKFRTRPPGMVIGPIGSGSLDLPIAYERASAMARHPFKFTLTGPHMLAKMLINHHYKDKRELAMAIAAVLAEQVSDIDADIVQLDEANLPGSPEEWQWAAESINVVLDAVKTKAAVHLCFGNYGGQSIQKGSWKALIDYLNALHVDHIIMECAHRPPDELAIFRELRPEIGFGLGVIDVKVTEIESAETIARTIERAEKTLGAGRVKYVHPDCGFWMLKRTIADGKMRALVRGRDLFEGRS